MLRSQHIKYKRPRKILERKLFHYNPNFEIMCIDKFQPIVGLPKVVVVYIYQSTQYIYFPY